MAVKFRPKYTMQKNLNIPLTIRTFALSGVCKIDFQCLVQNGMSKYSLESVRCGLKKIRGTALGNAMEICSAIENDLILTRAG